MPNEPAFEVHDPQNDTQDVGGGYLASGDITDAGYAEDATTAAFAVRTKGGASPYTDPSWATGQSLIAFQLETSFASQPERIAFITNAGGGGPYAYFGDPNADDPICEGVPATVNSDIMFWFARSCFNGIDHFSWQVMSVYGDFNNPEHGSVDVAPDDAPVQEVRAQSAHLTGYWMLGRDGAVHPFGDSFTTGATLPSATAMAPRKDGTGYWVTTAAGVVQPYGNARKFGSKPSLRSGEKITSISSTIDDNGYWLFSNQGRVFARGNAQWFGDMGAWHLNGPVIASAVTFDGQGYYEVGSDGGIFGFGNAKYHGSMGKYRLNAPIVGIAPTLDGAGYWLVGADGGVFGFNAPYRGSAGAWHLNKPVNGMVAYGNGYLMVASDGGVFAFSDKKFLGSLGNVQLSSPIIGIAAFNT